MSRKHFEMFLFAVGALMLSFALYVQNKLSEPYAPHHYSEQELDEYHQERAKGGHAELLENRLSQPETKQPSG